jgi:hypothetical protein
MSEVIAELFICRESSRKSTHELHVVQLLHTHTAKAIVSDSFFCDYIRYCDVTVGVPDLIYKN